MLLHPRLFTPGYAHCLVQWRPGNVDIFRSDEEIAGCLEDLAEQRTLLHIRIFGYCLLSTRILLVAQPERHGADLCCLMGNLADSLQVHDPSCTKSAGKRLDQFACSVLDTDDGVLACCRHVELSPVRAQIVSRPEDYRWSSYRCRAGYAAYDGCQDPDAAYMQLGRNNQERQRRYREFVGKGLFQMSSVPAAGRGAPGGNTSGGPELRPLPG